MMKKLIGAVGVVLMAGCASTGVQVDQNKLQAFERGVTTRSQIEAALGRPTMVQTMQDGKTTLTYTYANAQVRPATFVPIVGLFAGGTDVRADSVSIFLDAQGRYEATQSTTSEYGTGMGVSAGQPQARIDQPRTQTAQ